MPERSGLPGWISRDIIPYIDGCTIILHLQVLLATDVPNVPKSVHFMQISAVIPQ